MSTSARHRPCDSSARPGAAPSRKRATTRLEVERLEDRQLLSGGLDPTFAVGGKRTIPLPDGTTEQATAVAVQKDGKVILAGPSANGTTTDFALVRLTGNGSLDDSFGDGGRVTLRFDSATVHQVSSLTIDPATRKILVAGTATTSDGVTITSRFAVARLNGDGTFDTAFDGDGKQTLDIGGQSTVLGETATTVSLSTVALQSSGKILLSGTRYVSSRFQLPSAQQFVVARLNTDGSPDLGFDEDGRVDIAVEPALNQAAGATAAMALQKDGKIVLAGTTSQTVSFDDLSQAVVNRFTVLRLTPAGKPDGTFGSGGQHTFPLGTDLDSQARAVAIQADGKIVVGGITQSDPATSANTDFTLARLNTDGSLDSTFNSIGVQTVAFDVGGTKSDQLTALAVQRDGKIVAVGSAVTEFAPNSTSGVGTRSHFALARLDTDGSLDNTFDDDGQVHFGFELAGIMMDQASAAALRSDGKIVVAGSATLEGDQFHTENGMAVARVLTSDSTSTIGAFDPATATWYLRDSSGPGAPTITPFAYGSKRWAPVIGDWDGDGEESIGVFDPKTATWYLKNSNSPGAPDIAAFAYGGIGWLPVVGDWDGDGIDTIGVFDPTTGMWYLRNDNSPGAPDSEPFAYGAPGWVPVAGDWDGDGFTSIGVVDRQRRWYLKNENEQGAPDIEPFAFGSPGWKPVVGDWDGDGTTTVGVLDDQGRWYLRNRNSAGGTDIARFAYGMANWVPVAGDFAIPLTPLRAAQGQNVTNPRTAVVSAQELNTIVAAALGRLRDAGADSTLLARLAGATVEFGALPLGQLIQADPEQNRVVLDTNAAGYGWFVDPTPRDDEEFTDGRTAPLGTRAAVRVDLLTAVLFGLVELGGVNQARPGLNNQRLDTGIRKVGQLMDILATLGAVAAQGQAPVVAPAPVPTASGLPTTTVNTDLPVLGLPGYPVSFIGAPILPLDNQTRATG